MPKIMEGKIQSVAKTLTPAQHRALLWLIAASGQRDIWIPTSKGCTAATARALEECGCVKFEVGINKDGIRKRVKLKRLGRLVAEHGATTEPTVHGDGHHGGSRR